MNFCNCYQKHIRLPIFPILASELYRMVKNEATVFDRKLVQ